MGIAYKAQLVGWCAILLWSCTSSSGNDQITHRAGAEDDSADDSSDDETPDAGKSSAVDAGKGRDAGNGALDAKVNTGKAASDAQIASDAQVSADAKVGLDANVESDGAGKASACSGKPGSKRGKTNQMVTAAGAMRTFIYYAPQDLDPNEPVPLVIIPHGSTMSGQAMYDVTQYEKVADREKFVAIFPDGEDGPGSIAPWNVGDNTCGLGALVAGDGDDQSFVDEMIKFADDDQCIDHDHIFMTGFSMGGYFSHETACQNPKVRAVGPHSGATHDLSSCPVKDPKPVIIMHFKGDTLIDYSCATDARDKWVQRNGCSKDDPDVVNVKGGACEYYKGCPADGQVALCSFEEAPGSDEAIPSGHAWSGGSKDGEGAFAAITMTESATELSWSFFKKYGW